MAEPQDRTLAAVAYLLTWLTGILVLLITKDKYARWHAIQAIGLGVGLLLVWFVLTMLIIPLAFVGALDGGFGAVPFFAGGFFGMGLLWLVAILAILILALKAYQGEKVRLPVIADIADRNA
jgi:uncharacterized membrane protein